MSRAAAELAGRARAVVTMLERLALLLEGATAAPALRRQMARCEAETRMLSSAVVRYAAELEANPAGE